MGSLVFGPQGNLYGTTAAGGLNGHGVVFKLSPVAGGGWTETVLHRFAGFDGSSAFAGVILDSSGNLYGTTYIGGTPSACSGQGCGVVFQIRP